jgi:hypothetical protein
LALQSYLFWLGATNQVLILTLARKLRQLCV